MTAPAPDQPVTTRTYLFGEDTAGGSIAAIVRSLRVGGPSRSAGYGVAHLTGAPLNAVDTEIATVLTGLLELGVGDLLLAAWQTHTKLRAAAKATREEPGRTEIVELVTHQVTWTYHPTVDVLVEDVKTTSLTFVFTVELTIEGLVAVIRQGSLTALRAGDCVIATTLTLENLTILPRRETRIEDLRVVLPLRTPVPL